MVRINFQLYSRQQLEKIVEARLASAKEEMDEDKKPSQVVIAAQARCNDRQLYNWRCQEGTGYLQVFCFLFMPYLFPISFLSCRQAVKLVQATRGTVKAPHIREVVQSMQNSPTAAFLLDLSFHE